MKFLILTVLCIFSLTAFAQVEPTKVLTLEINTAQSLQKLYKLPRNAWFMLPTSLSASTSSSSESSVKIYYNLLSNNQYEFHCTYKSHAKSKNLDFVNCETMDGSEITSNVLDMQNMAWPMDKDSTVKMQLIYSKGLHSKIYATFKVDWK